MRVCRLTRVFRGRAGSSTGAAFAAHRLRAHVDVDAPQRGRLEVPPFEQRPACDRPTGPL